MTAGVNCVSSKFLLGFCKKRQNGNHMLSPLVGESVSGADERGKCEQARKSDSDLCTFTFFRNN